jgi:hypothetical protein
MIRFIDQVFNDSYLSTIGVDCNIKTMSVSDKVDEVKDNIARINDLCTLTSLP